MNTLRTLFVASIALGLTGFSAANAAAPMAGAYKLAIGTTSCPITLAADGTAAYSGDCASGGGVARWHAGFNKVELQTAGGDLVGVLTVKGDSYAGTRVSDGRMLVLTP